MEKKTNLHMSREREKATVGKVYVKREIGIPLGGVRKLIKGKGHRELQLNL